MNTRHIGININTLQDIDHFYKPLLGFQIDYQFQLEPSLAQALFGIKNGCEVYYLSNEETALELFFTKNSTNCGYAHLCFETEDPEQLSERARTAGFLHFYRKRNGKEPLIFLKDRSGNLFEIKKRR